MKLFFLLLALAPLLAAQDAVKLEPTSPAVTSTQLTVDTLKARIAELEKQLAQQAALYGQQVNDFATQSNSCTANFAVYKVTHPEQKTEQATGEKK